MMPTNSTFEGMLLSVVGLAVVVLIDVRPLRVSSFKCFGARFGILFVFILAAHQSYSVHFIHRSFDDIWN